MFPTIVYQRLGCHLVFLSTSLNGNCLDISLVYYAAAYNDPHLSKVVDPAARFVQWLTNNHVG